MKKSFTLTICCLICSLWSFAQMAAPRFSCGTDDSHLNPAIIQAMQRLNNTNNKAREQAAQLLECRIAVDVDNGLYKAFGGDVSAIKQYVYQTVQNASVVFERELFVKLTIVYINIWNTNDPYTKQNNLTQHLADMTQWWRLNMKAVDRDFIISYSTKQDPAASGVAYLGINNFSEAAAIGYNEPGATDRNATIIHEIGHIMGSPHTHNCNWPGGPIDLCGQIEGGSCYSGPQVAQIGTVMSFCHTVFGGGRQTTTFHPLCIELMRRNAEIVLSSRVISRVPSQPAGISSVIANRTDPYLEWSSVNFAERYRLQLADAADFRTGIVLDTLLNYPLVQLGNVSTGRTYYWRVKAQNTAGESEWSINGQLAVTTDTRLRPPGLRFPVNGMENVASNVVSWYPADGATGYVIQANYSTALTSPAVSRTLTAATTSFDLSAVNSFGNCQYNCWLYWRVKSLKDGAESDWSSVHTYRRSLQIGTIWPELTRSTTIQHQLSIPISWYDYNGEAATSTIHISTVADFSTIAFVKILSYNQLNDPAIRSNLVVMADSLKPNTKYYYRIKLKSTTTGYETPWSISSFQTGTDSRRWHYANPANTSIPMSDLNQLAFDTSGVAWLATNQGLFRRKDDQNWAIATTTANLPTTASSISFSRKNTGYLLAGFSIYQQNGNNWTKLPNPPNVTYPTGTLIADDNGVYLLSAYSVHRYDGTRWITFNSPDLVANAYIYQGVVDTNNHLWIRYFGRTGLGHYDGSRWETISMPLDYTYDLAIDRSRTTLLIAARNGLIRFNALTKTTETITSRSISGADNQWFTQGGFDTSGNPLAITQESLYRFDGKTWLTQPLLSLGNTNTQLDIDWSNRIFLLNNSLGLSIYEPRTLTAALSKTEYCSSDPVIITFAPSYTAQSDASYQVEVFDPTSNRFTAVASVTTSNTAVVTLPVGQAASSAYKARIVARQGSHTIYGDDSSPFAVRASPKVTVTPTGNVAFCFGTPFSLQASSDPGASLQWLKDGVAIGNAGATSLSITQAGSYALQATLNNCQATSSPVSLSLKEGVSATVTAQGSTLVYAPDKVNLLANSGSGYSYQWYKDGSLLTEATSVSYSASQTGAYTVLVTDPNGCNATATSVSITVAIPLANEPSAILENWQLTPNPVEHTCTVSFGKTPLNKPVTLLLTDTNGRIVLQKTLPANSTKIELMLNGLPAGAYTLHAESQQTVAQKRLIKQ